MKLLPKIVLAVVTAGAGATMYAAPGGWLSPNGTGGAAAVSESMSLEEMLVKAQTLKTEMVTDYQHVEHLQLIARKEKDVIKLNCVNDKLVEMKPEMNIADRSTSDLQSTRDPADQRQAFDSISQSGNRVRELKEAADQCVGERLMLTESSNDYTHPPIVENPEDNPFPTFTLEPPAYASPVN